MDYPRYQFFPRTEHPPEFVNELVRVFAKHRDAVDTEQLEKGLTSDLALSLLRTDLEEIGFEVEGGKAKHQKVERPVFFGLQGEATLRYEIDAFNPEWRCGLEIEAGRATMGNAIYRDLVQAMVMVNVDILAIAVPNAYKFQSKGRTTVSRDFDNARAIAEALFGHSRFQLPYRLLLIGY